MPALTARKYRAFISYSHAADNRLAPALQTGLHKFAKPWYRLRAMRVFRDRTGLAVTPALWGTIQKALADSDYFILLASPQAAQSEWVQQEIDWWLRNRSPDHLLIVCTDGELAWDRAAADFDWPVTNALPRLLAKAFAEEPNFLDMRFARRSEDLTLRHPKFLEAIAGLSATLQGRSLDELVGEDVGQHRKTMRLLRIAALGSVVLTIAAGVAIYMAQKARSTADEVADEIAQAAKRQQREADSRRIAERSLTALATDRELAVLLAAQANCAHPGDAAMSALRQALSETLAPRLSWQAHAGGAYFAGFTPDGGRVISGGDDRTARLWDSDSGRLLLELTGHAGGITGADFSPDGKRIATSSRYDHTARVWDAVNAKPLLKIEDEGLTDARFSPDGRKILTTALKAVLWDAGSGAQERILASRYGQLKGVSSLEAIDFSPDGTRVALVDWQPSVVDAGTGKALFDLDGHDGQVFDIAYSPDGAWLATAGGDRTARVWRASNGQKIAVLPHEAAVRGARFTSNGRWIVTHASDRKIRVWDAVGKAKVAEIEPGTEELAGFEVSPDGNFVVTWSEEQSVHVFETGTGSRLVELTGHAAPIFSASFDPGERHIVTAGLDGRMRLFDFELGGTTEHLLALARRRVTRPMSADERTQHLPASFREPNPPCP